MWVEEKQLMQPSRASARSVEMRVVAFTSLLPWKRQSHHFFFLFFLLFLRLSPLLWPFPRAWDTSTVQTCILEIHWTQVKWHRSRRNTTLISSEETTVHPLASQRPLQPIHLSALINTHIAVSLQHAATHCTNEGCIHVSFSARDGERERERNTFHSFAVTRKLSSVTAVAVDIHKLLIIRKQQWPLCVKWKLAQEGRKRVNSANRQLRL